MISDAGSYEILDEMIRITKKASRNRSSSYF